MQIRILRAAAITSFEIVAVPSNVEPMFALPAVQNDSSTPAPRTLPPFGAGEIAVCSYWPIDCLVIFLVAPIVIADDRVKDSLRRGPAYGRVEDTATHGMESARSVLLRPGPGRKPSRMLREPSSQVFPLQSSR